jgi:hypothetical protein
LGAAGGLVTELNLVVNSAKLSHVETPSPAPAPVT